MTKEKERKKWDGEVREEVEREGGINRRPKRKRYIS